ncbi:VOC family protein [Rossellomorea marisflavi]|uniref:VOC family protein n=1 Tax=Rossellomorea marisflavi TaxID=189381 RepID=UPI002852F7BE|nr:VOC family protein [Rossellomorea marisflavi]MDR4937847.1 VOC family protein [Rossellomorea marisflavi]
MKTPIQNRIHTIFIHVRDLKASAHWYADLLGQEVDLDDVIRPVHTIPVADYTSLTLDAGPEGEQKDIVPARFPIFNFHADDIHEAHGYVEGIGIEVVQPITSFDDFSFFTVKDPDGHLIMICTG